MMTAAYSRLTCIKLLLSSKFILLRCKQKHGQADLRRVLQGESSGAYCLSPSKNNLIPISPECEKKILVRPKFKQILHLTVEPFAERIDNV
jgi:hypothetical protein